MAIRSLFLLSVRRRNPANANGRYIVRYTASQLGRILVFSDCRTAADCSVGEPGTGSFFGTGEVRLAVLSLLAKTPKHGYQLMKDLGERLGDLYRTSAGTVHPTLKQLEKEGLVESQSKQGRHVYRLTKEGRKAVVADGAIIEQIWSRAAEFHGWGERMGPHTLVIASPLQEVISAGLAAAQWSSGNSDREDRVRTVLREAAARLRNLATQNQPAGDQT